MKLRTRYVFRSPSIAFPYLMLGKKLTSSALRRNTFHFLPRISTEVDKITHAIHGPRIFSFENISLSLSLFLSVSLSLCSSPPSKSRNLTFPRPNDPNDHQQEGGSTKYPKRKGEKGRRGKIPKISIKVGNSALRPV